MRPSDAPVRERRNLAWHMAGLFLLVGAAWVLLTDVLLYQLVHEPTLIARLETAKGWAFILGSGAAVYLLVSLAAARLQRSQALTQAILDSIADGILLVGKDTRVTRANPAALRMLGISRPEDLAGMTPEVFCRTFRVSRADGSIVAPDDLHSQRVLRGELAPPYRAVLHAPSGRRLVIIATSAPVRVGKDCGIEQVVSVMHDITEADDLEQLRDAFFEAAAHSLKTPLAVIKAHAQLLRLRAATEADRSAADAIDRQVGAMNLQAENLLVLARIRSSTLRLHPCDVELATVVAQVIREAGRGRSSAIQGIVEAEPVVFADPERLEQVLRNLVLAAVQRAPPGAPVTLRLEQEGGMARMSVAAEETIVIEDAARTTVQAMSDRVSEHLISVSGGRIMTERTGGERISWVEIPSLPGRTT